MVSPTPLPPPPEAAAHSSSRDEHNAASNKKPPALASRAELGWNKINDAVARVPDTERQLPNVGLQLAGSVALATVETLRKPAFAGRLAKLVSIEEAPGDLIERAENFGWACIHARRHQLETTAAASAAKVPEALAKESQGLRDRMFKLCEYHFGDDPTLGPSVAYVREGTGYLDRANDLEALADLCEQHPDAIKADPRNYRATDVADARRVAAALYSALGDERDGSAYWMQSQSGLWPLLLQTWAEVQQTGRFLEPMGQGETLFPSQVSAARALAPKSSPPAKTEPNEPTPPLV